MVVRWVDASGEPLREELGGKGYGLAQLTRAGFPVPRAFVFTADGSASLPDSPADWPAGLRRELTDAVNALAPGGQLLAIRSSSAAEDSHEASFAGQHESLLNVAPGDALRAIARVLASADGPGAAAYRAERGVAAGSMAVVVQAMVPARAAGVAFSVEPLTGAADRIVVEAVPGLGDALAAGTVEGERVVLARPSLRVLERSGEAVLSDAEAAAVAALALRAEELFGEPQDVEFAFDAETLWILQSRPVTALARGAAVGEFDSETSTTDLWTSANIGEVLPGLLRPLTITVMQRFALDAYVRGYQDLGTLARDESPAFVGFFHHRAFLSVNATRLIAERSIGTSGDAIEHRFLGGDIDSRGPREPVLRRWKYRLRSTIPTLRMAFTIHKQGERAERETLALERRLRAEDPSRLSGVELEARREELARFVTGTFALHLQMSGCAGAGFDMVSQALQPVLGDATEGTVPRLFTGMRGVESAQIGLDLWGLSQAACDQGLEAALRTDRFDALDARLSDSWRSAFAGFLDRHGHRGLHEMEPAEPSWRQDPAPVVAMLRAYLDLPPEQSPPAVLDRQEAERERLTAELCGRMNPLRRAFFRFVLRYAQRWVAMRERTKSVVVRGTRVIEHYLPEMQSRLVADGVIADPGDIFFLTDTELADALGGRAASRLERTVARRRRAYEADRYVRLPERFNGRPEPLPPDLTSAAGTSLRGTAVSPGIVTGRARVIMDPRRDSALKPGEILVAPVTDAGWTPLFALASGLVVDMGSALSHGSTVAREFGLPAIVNVRDGTARIRTGDLLTLDGTRGIVTVIETDD